MVVKALHTLLRRFWHKQCVRHPQQELNMNECMLLEGVAMQVLVTVTIYVLAHSCITKTHKQLIITGSASVPSTCTIGAQLPLRMALSILQG